MHACFHGGGSGRMKSISIIRDLAKNMKAMSLKVKAGGGGSHARGRRRRRGRRPEEEEDRQLQDKDSAAAAAASASAKIAPAQLQEADEPAPSSDSHQPRKEERGGKRQVHCDKCCSHLDDVAEEEEAAAAAVATDHAAGEESDREWVAEPEPGVLMTLVSRPDGTNHLRRLRFREELFDGPRAAQRWWADNYDSIVELYSIVQSGGGSHEDAEEDDEDDEPVTPCQSEDDHRQPRRWQRPGCDSASTSGPSSGSGSGGGSASTLGSPILGLVVATPNSSKRERSTGPAASDKCRSLHRN